MVQDIVTKTIIFKLDQQEFGASIAQIRSIERLEEIVPIPQTSEFIKGIINLRGSVTPIIDLRTRLGLEQTETDDQTRILIANVRDVQVGFIVDEATDVLDIDTERIDEAPELVQHIDYRYLKGVAKIEDRGMILLLDLDQVLTVQEADEVQQVVED
ncbi:chemotaxis protein CheW [Gracilibacillus timonensis]|uniref:chemotaxis protein CheW n=1 Tax=Gracilibacillus timonensis TaxID=1816696 RepID=UPI000824045D|nr:chemotaxis protein CheW [Gracilibacillus timonensis]